MVELRESYAQIVDQMSTLRSTYDAEGESAMEEISGLQEALEKERAKRRGLYDQLQQAQEQLREAQCELEMQGRAAATAETEVGDGAEMWGKRAVWLRKGVAALGCCGKTKEMDIWMDR